MEWSASQLTRRCGALVLRSAASSRSQARTISGERGQAPTSSVPMSMFPEPAAEEAMERGRGCEAVGLARKPAARVSTWPRIGWDRLARPDRPGGRLWGAFYRVRRIRGSSWRAGLIGLAGSNRPVAKKFRISDCSRRDGGWNTRALEELGRGPSMFTRGLPACTYPCYSTHDGD